MRRGATCQHSKWGNMMGVSCLCGPSDRPPVPRLLGAGSVSDDVLFETVKEEKDDPRMRCLMITDCCHSGSMFELPTTGDPSSLCAPPTALPSSPPPRLPTEVALAPTPFPHSAELERSRPVQASVLWLSFAQNSAAPCPPT